jgi:serine protease AprX
MHRPATFVQVFVALFLMAAFGQPASAQLGSPVLAPPLPSPSWISKLDSLLQRRVNLLSGQSPVIVRAIDGASLGLIVPIIRGAGGTLGRALPIIDSQAANVPNASLPILANSPLIRRLSLDRVTGGAMERTGETVGAAAVRYASGYDGSGVGVAIIDSGVTSWHDDLTSPAGAQRVDRFVDFVNGRSMPYDDYGHGTHVAGIVAGNGFDSGGARSGIAPAAHLIVLKTLDGSGRGRISDVIAALGYVVAHKHDLNIRVVNLSVGTGVYESYNDDPLTLAAKRAVSEGIVVVAAAGNTGRDPQGRTRYGGITAPGNAPWVLTVGASSHMGTVDREDDTIAAFSSRGPSALDYAFKPDVVAPGVGIESLSDPDSAFYTVKSRYLLNGTVPTSYLPYLSLTGTSMATPVVTGTVALMLQANPALTPNQVKAIVQYTAQVYRGYDPLTQGAGFVNAKGAVKMARFFAAASSAVYPSSSKWSARLIWGNHLVRGGRLTADANAWSTSVTWGAATTPSGQNVEWGLICSNSGSGNCDNGGGTWNRWGATCLDAACSSVTWGAGYSRYVYCGAAVCGTSDETVVWGTAEEDTVVWGTGTTEEDGDTVVWGTGTTEEDGDTVVWGTGTTEGDGETVVWGTGTTEGDTVVWGTSCSDPSCEPVIWNYY